MITQEQLKELLDYNQDTGIFTRKVKTSNRVVVGKECGCKAKSGYLYLSIFNKLYRVHRLVWLYVYGEMPICHIDHINGIKNDNRISNLRLCTVTQNLNNIGMKKNNTSGYRGVRLTDSSKKWRADIMINKKRIFLGSFDSAKAASMAYELCAKENHKNFYREVIKD
jgi:hypothetical protein